jgi:heme/copper-type cytochrome/quinol oxidase subunit 2
MGADAIIAVGVGIFLIYVIVTIMFLLSQSKFAKSMKTSNEMKNTSGVWIWTQLIPLWSFIAIPVTLMKLNEQFRIYTEENNLENKVELKQYNNTWGWVWFGGSVLSILFQPLAIIAFIGLIGFWIHISGVKKSLVNFQNNLTTEE